MTRPNATRLARLGSAVARDIAGQGIDLRVTIDSEGEAPPPLGFNLDLSGGDGAEVGP
jgi:hypothetical protein